MISRRITRVKVLQSLYAYDRDEQLTFKEALEYYRELSEKTFELYLFSVHILVQFCSLAIEDEKKRKKKYLPTDDDKMFRPILYRNKIVQSLVKDPAFAQKVKKADFQSLVNRGVLNRLYKTYSEGNVYKAYYKKEEHREEDHIRILHDIVRFLKNEEAFQEVLTDAYMNWIDDESLVLGALKKTLKSLPVEESFLKDSYPTKKHSKYALACFVEFCKLFAETAEPRLKIGRSDEKFTPALMFHNPLIQSLYRNSAFRKTIKDLEYDYLLDKKEMLRLKEIFSESDAFLDYVAHEERGKEEHVKVLQQAVRFLMEEEFLVQAVKEKYDDDLLMEKQLSKALLKTLADLPTGKEFYESYYPSEETVKNFGEKLLRTVYEKDRELEIKIAEVLENWDLDRLAIVDLLILKMGVTELTQFPKIPGHVTINEYVELAKMYSTSKSRVFINGILDKIMKNTLEND